MTEYIHLKKLYLSYTGGSNKYQQHISKDIDSLVDHIQNNVYRNRGYYIMSYYFPDVTPKRVLTFKGEKGVLYGANLLLFVDGTKQKSISLSDKKGIKSFLEGNGLKQRNGTELQNITTRYIQSVEGRSLPTQNDFI